MKTSKLLNIILAVALVVVSVRLAMNGGSAPKGSSSEADNTMDVVYNNILTRASVRSYQDKPVEDEKTEKLLRAGMAAPTAVNKQPWHFVVVRNKATLEAIAEATPNAGMAKDAPLAIVVCGDMDKEEDDFVREFWIQDASAATENILLAAHGMGLGAVWTGTYPDKKRCDAISKLLNLPAHIIPFSTIVIGYPKGETTPKDKWKPENVSYESFRQAQTGMQKTVEKPVGAKEFKEFDVTEDFHGNPFTYFKGKGLLLAVGDKSDFNEMTIGWGALGNIWEGDLSTITVYVSKSRHTFGYMEKAKYFTVMEFDDSHKEILNYMGTHSGRDGNKAKALGLHTRFTEHGTPYFEEAKTVFECEMIYHAPFDPQGFGSVPQKFYSNYAYGIHSIYMGKIVKAMRK